jgi:hypothetical protein
MPRTDQGSIFVVFAQDSDMWEGMYRCLFLFEASDLSMIGRMSKNMSFVCCYPQRAHSHSDRVAFL